MSHDPEHRLDAALRDALRVEPAPDFLPRLRERLQGERPAPPVPWRPAALLAGATLGLAVMLAWQRFEEDATPGLRAPARSAAVPAPPVPATRPVEAPPPAPVRRGIAPRRSVQPEILVPAGQDAAIARFASGIEALEQGGALATVLARSPSLLSDLRVEPLSIEPLARNGT